MNKSLHYTLLSLLFLVLITACGPVHRFTRVKKIPREYSLNYCGGEIKAPKTDINKKPWIVFSDREKNQSFNNAGGKVKAKDVDYLDPFLVIGKKGDFLKLIKYTPTILKNGKLQYKEAEYYGWIHKTKLVLNQQSHTDIASGKKNKTLVSFSDTLLLNAPESYFATDSIKIFKDLTFTSVNGTIAPLSIVYRIKTSENGAQTLVANKAYINAEEVKQDVLGWVDNSLLQDVGTGLHVDYAKLPHDSLPFILNTKGERTLLNEFEDFESELLSEQYKAAKYSPVTSYSVRGAEAAYRIRVPLPLFDKRDNYVFNVNGGQITYREFNKIAKSLKKINIAFVFEGKEQTIDQFPQIINALQGLQPLFEDVNDAYSYNFSCITNFYDSKNTTWERSPVSIDLQPEYSRVMNYLSERANNKDHLKPLALSRTWSSLRTAVSSFNNCRDATNLIVLIGEKGFNSDSFDSAFMNQLERNNCRILGFQTFAGEDNSYNNFVLDVESLISSYANKMLETKGNVLVSPQQVKRNNMYREIPDTKNSFRLDFPDNSITQGFILFPSKGETLPMEILSTSIDTMLQQIRMDNKDITTCMSRAFNQVGNNRTKYDSLFMASFHLDKTKAPLKKTISSFRNENPAWHLPSEIIVLHDSLNNDVNYRLLLSELEMEELKEFVADLSSIEADYKYRADEKKKAKRNPCNCPDDDLFLILDAQNESNDSIPPEYANTKKARKHIYKLHVSTIRYCKLCKEKEKHLKKQSLAELQRRVTGCPSSNEMLNSIKAEDIKNKKIVTDKMLDELIGYYKSKLDDLNKAEQFESNGETYYWVERKHLP